MLYIECKFERLPKKKKNDIKWFSRAILESRILIGQWEIINKAVRKQIRAETIFHYSTQLNVVK